MKIFSKNSSIKNSLCLESFRGQFIFDDLEDLLLTNFGRQKGSYFISKKSSKAMAKKQNIS